MEFLRHRGAADDVAAFENECVQTSSCKIKGADEAVMAAADNDCIIRAFVRPQRP
jgi:hypothetical protein